VVPWVPELEGRRTRLTWSAFAAVETAEATVDDTSTDTSWDASDDELAGGASTSNTPAWGTRTPVEAPGSPFAPFASFESFEPFVPFAPLESFVALGASKGDPGLAV
jgi:hypothetical protein